PTPVLPGVDGHRALGNGADGNGHDTNGSDGNGTDGSGTDGGGVAPRRRRSRPRQDGVIVPLRVPLGTRLKAGVGLCALVVVLGTAAAIVVAGMAVAGAQALSGL
ncbi:MAG TPA: hypothetical protein VFM27_12690, partial [Acidimicrobiales bacterium]|nr:hypothetical protein [Acidimicrobiales bacterium]